MRKDYISIDSVSNALDEAGFVEHFWTEQWRDRGSPPDVSAVAGREEYRLMRPYLERIRPGSRILDGGCGLGEWTVYLSQRGFDVTGLDISEQTVGRLQVWFPNSHFSAGDLRRTSFADGFFDAYLSWGTFEHFESGLGEWLVEARRIVKPGEWLFVSVPYQNWRLLVRDLRPLERWDESFDPNTGYRAPQRFYQWRLTQPELRRELELHGFRVHSLTPIAKLTGAGRMLQWDPPIVTRSSRSYGVACRALAAALPARFLSHMILAVAERR